MQQALVSPVFRSIAVGSLLLALSVGAFAATSSRHGRRLVLHAYAQPHALYLTAWRNGDVPVPFEGKQLLALTFTTLASVDDGCRWLATETLVPMDGRHYHYAYDETLLECNAGATPCVRTPRTGIVTVED